MANEFKIKKGLIVTGASGGTVVDIQGSQGQLFSVTDNLSGSIFAVSDISGVPIFDVNSSGVSYFDGTVGIGTSSPGKKLEVKSDITYDGIQISGSSIPTLAIIDTTNNAKLVAYARDSDATIGTETNHALTINTNNTTALTLANNQNANFAGDVTVSGGDLNVGNSSTVNSVINMLGTNDSFIEKDTGNHLYFANNVGDKDIKFRIKDDTTNVIALTIDGSEGGDATFVAQAFSAATSSGDASSTLTTKGYVDGLITGATIYRGAWDPSGGGYGSPDLSGVTQTSGYYYICSAAGTAEPNGTGCEPDSWETGDWVIWNDDIVDCAGTGTGGWQKIDNSSVLSGVGTGQTVALWEGAGSVTDSETLGNAPITVSGNNTTFAGDIIGGGSITIGSGGAYNAGAIFSDANWGMIFRSLQASPNNADFMFADSADVERLRITSTGATFAGTVNANLGIVASGAMSTFETTLTNNDDWENSPISILERGNVQGTQTADKYAPNLNFHWGAKYSASLWMSVNGHLHYGTYGSTGIPTSDGTINAATFSGDLHGTINTATTGTTQTAGDDSTKIATTAYADAAAAAVPIGDYLPLAGGTMTGNVIFPGEEANSFKIAFTGASASSGLSTVDQSGAGLYIGANSRVNTSGNIVFHDTLLPSSGIYFDGWSGDDMEFYTGLTGNPTKRLTINSDGNAIFTGNVGINQTVNPTNYTLEVNGAVEGDSFSVEGSPARIFAPSGAKYNGSGTQTGYLIVKLPDNGASGINNMMTGVIRVFDYTHNESFDVHFAGYWYSGYNWTNCSAWIESSANDDRNFTVRFGEMTGSAGANTRPYITIGEATSTWTYCKFSVINYEAGHSNYEAYKWNKGWSMDISATNPGNVLVTKSNAQVNNWARNGQDVYYGSGTGNVGIGTTSPSDKLDVTDGNSKMVFGGASSDRPLLYFQHNAVPVNAEEVGLLDFRGYNDASQDTRYVILTAKAEDVTDGSEDGSLTFQTMKDGTATQSMTLRSGNVGIGTTNPGSKLVVAGGTDTAYNDGTLKVVGSIALNAANNLNPALNRWALRPRAAGVEGSFDIYDARNSLSRLTIVNSGNVGIGEASPTAKLEVHNSGGTVFNVTGSQGQLFSVTDNLSGSIFAVSDISGVPIFDVNSSGASYFDGNVGIGLNSPNAKLNVDGGIKIEGSNSLSFGGTASVPAWGINNSGNNLIINDQATTSGDVLFTNDGEVGVGTTTPGAKFHVEDSATYMAQNPDVLKISQRSPEITIQDIGSSIGYVAIDTKYQNTAGYSVVTHTVQSNPGGAFNRWIYDTGGPGGTIMEQKQNSFHWSVQNSQKLTLNSLGYLGINDTTPGYSLDVNGGGRFTGTVIATNFILSSDERLKENIEKVCDNRVKADWKTFELKTDKGQKRYGVIAQELEKTNPEFVREDVDGFKSVAYIDLLIAKIAELEARLEKLEK